MRSSIFARLSKALSLVCAAALCCSLVPTTALASQESLSLIPEGGQGAASVITSGAEGGDADVLALRSADDASSVDGGGAVTSSENVSDSNIINQTMPLETVAQQESTRSYFLAQTLESTRTVPIVSANLPLDKGTADEAVDAETPAEGEGSSEDEGGDDSDESDLGGDVSNGGIVAPGVSSESTIVGSFTYLGMTFAVEPGGESAALVAVDYSKLPEEFVQKQILVVPDAATPDGADYYSVTRIAANAFSSLTKDNANPNYTGCIELFSDEELLAEAGIDPAEVARFLSQDEAAAATEDGQDAGASSGSRAKAEAFARDNGDEPSVISDIVALSDDEGEISDGIRTIVSMDGNVAVLDDGSTYTFVNPLEGCAGILSAGIPASVTSIEDNAFVGADTLKYVIVSEDNPSYSSYDGVLYDVDQVILLVVPEGRTSAVRVAPAAARINPNIFSQCAVDIAIINPNSEACQLLLENEYRNNGNKEIQIACLTELQVNESPWFSLDLRDEVMALWKKEKRLSNAAFALNASSESSRISSHAQAAYFPLAPIPDGNKLLFYLDNKSRKDIYLWASQLQNNQNTGYPSGFGQATVLLAPNDRIGVYLYSSSANSQHKGVFRASTGVGMSYYLTESSIRNGYHYFTVGASLTDGGATETITGIRDASGKEVHSDVDLTLGETYTISEIGGKNILDYTVVWNAGAYGSTIIKDQLDESENLNDDASILERVVPMDDLMTPSELENTTDVIDSVHLEPSSGFPFKGWAAQKKNGEAFETDAHGNKVLNEGADSRYKVYNEATFQMGWVCGPFTEESQIIDDDGSPIPGETLADWKLVIEEDTTFYAVFEADFTFNGVSYGGKVQEQDADGKPVLGSFADEAVLRNVRWGDTIEGPDVEAKGDGWNFEGWVSVPNDGASQLTSQGGALEPSKTVAPKDDPASTTYYGVWSCDVSWANSDESAGSIDSSGCMTDDVVYGTSITCPTTTAEPTHAFLRWEGAGSTSAGGTIEVLEPGVITARWAPNVYKVVFKDKDGNDRTDAAVSSLFVKYGDGWYRDGACTDKVNSSLAGGHIGTTERAGFELIGYSRDENATTPEFFYSGTSASDYAFSATEHPAANDIFSDSTTSSGDTWTEGDLTLKVAYLYPVWKATATWSWDNDGVTENATDARTVSNGAKPTVSIRAQGARPGYTPAGWAIDYADASLADATIAAGQTGTVELEGSCTITAQWTPVLYDIAFDLGTIDYDGETFGVSSNGANLAGDTGNLGSPITWVAGNQGTAGTAVSAAARYDVTNGSVTLPTFTREGFSLLGWKVKGQPSENGSPLADKVGDAAADYAPYSFTTAPGSDQVRGSVSFEAVWAKADAYPISVAATLDGTAHAIEALHDGTVALPSGYTVSGTGRLENPVGAHSPSNVAGYEFVGWSASVDGFLQDATTGEALDKGVRSEDVRIAAGQTKKAVTLTAHFETVYYDLTVDLALPDAAGAYDATNWTKDAAGNGYVFKSSTLKGATSGYSLYDKTIPIPTPSRTGQVFDGWTVEKLDDDGDVVATDVVVLSKPVTAGGNWTMPVALDTLGHYRLTANWTASPYTLQFDGIDHVADKDTGAFVSASEPTGAADEGYSAEGRTFGFSGDNLTSGGVIQVTAPDYDETRYTGFLGWYLPAGVSMNDDPVVGNAWSYDATAKRYYATEFVIAQANLERLFTKDANGDYRPLALEARFSMKADHTAVLDLDGGKLVAPDAAWSEQADGTFMLSYSSDASKRLLPEVSRYGHVPEDGGWVLSWKPGDGVCPEELANAVPDADGVRSMVLTKSTPAGETVEGYWIPADAVGGRTYTAQWRALTDSVAFRDNAPDSEMTAVGPAPQTVTFGEPIPSGLAQPQREGYDFRGYFDTAASAGGVQYVTADMVGARLWDKAPEFEEDGTTAIPHELYARWVKSAPEGTNPENEPIPGVIAPAPPAEPDPNLSTSGTFSAKKGDGSGAVSVPKGYFDAYYNGFFTRATDDTVTVSIDSYVLKNGGTAKDIYDAFQLNDADAATDANGEPKKYLQGFMVDSTKSIIAFADIARGSSFELAFKVADMESDVADAASFTLDGLKLTALYSSTPYDFTDPGGGEPPSILPKDGDAVLAVFDPAGGTINGDASPVLVETIYQAGVREQVSPLPAEPQREGYDFLGWSFANACASGKADDADHAKTGELFDIEDVLVKHYIAHWAEKTYPVRLFNNDGNDAYVSVDVKTGSTASLGTLLNVDPYEGPSRGENYLFLGYFDDAEGGIAYYTSEGEAARAFDKTVPAGAQGGFVSLFAHWLYLGGSGPGDPGDIDPNDPFPGRDDVIHTQTKAPNNRIDLKATDGDGVRTTQALLGTYDGVHFATEGSDDVAVRVYSYKAADVDHSLRKIIERYEAAPESETMRYLQGFEVLSTGSFVSIADMWNGLPVTFTAKAADLEPGVTPASATFAPGAVRAVYGPTSPIKPDNWDPAQPWPVPGDPNDPGSGTRFYNVFDARGGLFGSDAGEYANKRFMAVPTGFNLEVAVPDAVPNYDAIDSSYRFAGWCDASGNLVFDALGNSQLESGPFQPARGVTYYAKYEQVMFTFDLHDELDGVKDIHRSEGSKLDAGASFEVYNGQELTAVKTNGLGQPMPVAKTDFEKNLPAERPGYDFIGYFFKQKDGSLKPFYLNTASKYAMQYISSQGYEVVSEYWNSQGSGWGNATGAVDPGDTVDLYALWNVKTYTVQWTYNWYPERSYVYTETDDDGNDVTKPKPITVEYGAAVDAAADAENGNLDVPVIKDPAYSFLGWFAGKTSNGNDAVRVALKPVSYTPGGHAADGRAPAYNDGGPASRDAYYFALVDGTRRFQPGNIANVDDTADRTFEFFACFSDTAENYNYRVYFGNARDGVHGSISEAVAGEILEDAEKGMRYLAATYRPAAGANLSTTIGTVANPNHITADDGYSFAGFHRDLEGGDAVEEPVTIPRWTTGLQEFYLGWTANPYRIVLTMDTLDLGGESRERPQGDVLLNGSAVYDLNLNDLDDLDGGVRGRIVELPTPTGAIGYAFKGWKRCDADGALHGGANIVEDGRVIFDTDFVRSEFGGGTGGTIHYGAVWEPVNYQVRFHVQRSTDDGFDLFDEYALAAVGSTDTARASELVLPYPHTKGVSHVFEFWSLDRFDSDEDGEGMCSEWRSGTTLTLADMLAMQKRMGLAETTDGMASGESKVIDLYAQWREMVSADVPLQLRVNILVDPWMPDQEDGRGKIITNSADAYVYEGDAVVANGWVGTTSSSTLRIESLTFERGKLGDADTLFDDANGVDQGGKLSLRIFGGGKGQRLESEALSLSLGVPSTVVLRDDKTNHGTAQGGHIHGERLYLADYGLDATITAGEPLLLYYDLGIDTADGTLAEFVNLMDILDKTHADGSATERDTRTLANLYYTIGLA